jgi:murein DD-endopeptidase MepM/ murein hydrolase activator NlpD
MGLPGDDRVADQRTQPERAPARRFGAGDADVVPFRRRQESLAERLERERLERERAERERRARIERERAARERAAHERMERRRRERAEWLRREREEALRWRRRTRTGQRPTERAGLAAGQGGPPASPRHAAPPATDPPPPEAAPSPKIHPGAEGPVRKRERAAENRRRAATRRMGLFWPTAKAGFAVTAILGVSAALGTLIGLPAPGLDAGRQSLAGTASLFRLDPGTAPGLASGYVSPVLGPHEFGEADARFGASRYGHVHEGQDIFAKSGTPEVAVHDGVVVDRGVDGGRYSGGRGNYLVIYEPADDRSFVYMHMLKPSPLRLGERVHTGQVIGRLGCSGSCWGPHLHFEVRIGKATLHSQTKAVDPLPYLRQWPQATPG